MARTVDDPIRVPAPQAQALAEIASTNGRAGGLEAIARCQNSLYEQKRGSLVIDSDVAPFLDSLGEIARYRCKRQGKAGLSDELVVIALELEAVAFGGGPIADITISDGTNSQTWTYAGDITPRQEVAAAGDMTIDDANSEFIDLEVEITTLVDLDLDVYSISIYYKRDKAGLTGKVPGYGNGFIAQELTEYADNKPVSAHRLHHTHHNLEHLHNERGSGQICARAYKNPLPSETGTILSCEVPESVDEVRVWIYASGGAGKIQLDVNGDNQITDNAPVAGWNGYLLTVVEFTETRIDIYGETVVFEDISAYFMEGAY